MSYDRDQMRDELYFRGEQRRSRYRSGPSIDRFHETRNRVASLPRSDRMYLDHK